LSESQQKGRTSCQPESASFRPALLFKLELFPSEFFTFLNMLDVTNKAHTLAVSERTHLSMIGASVSAFAKFIK
jgi:hypothetical protein